MLSVFLYAAESPGTVQNFSASQQDLTQGDESMRSASVLSGFVSRSGR
jgi:hypothetical protein